MLPFFSVNKDVCVCYPQVPRRVPQNAILQFLPVKFNFCRKMSAAKFLCVKNSKGKL